MNTIIGDNAVIYLPQNKIDNETQSLVKDMTKSQVFNNIRIMPDCHSSSYCCVGLTSMIEDKVIPQIVGGDIGCGISCLNLNKVLKEKHYEKIDKAVKLLVPMGDKNHKIPITNDEIMNELYSKCNVKLDILKKKFPEYPFNDFQYNDKYYYGWTVACKDN